MQAGICLIRNLQEATEGRGHCPWPLCLWNGDVGHRASQASMIAWMKWELDERVAGLDGL
jgi:hypothetical protein